jgi:6-phosphogluconolactonase (cycloisomerase 2 family)
LATDGTYVYVAEGTEWGTGGQIQVFNTSGAAQSIISTYNGTNAFKQPNGVAYSSSNIYVVDQVSNAVYEVSPSANTLTSSISTWTASPVGAPASFLNPEGIAVTVNSGTATVYVADTGNDYIEVFSVSPPTVSLVKEFGGSVNGQGTFNNPSAVAIDSNYIYVADASNQLIQIFNETTYAPVTQFSTGSNSDVYGLTLDPSGHIYVADSGTSQIEEYDTVANGNGFITSGLGETATKISPYGLVFIGSNLLVADYSNSALYLVTP